MEYADSPRKSVFQRPTLLVVLFGFGLYLWMTRVKNEPPHVASPVEIAELRNLGVAHLENLDFGKADALLEQLAEVVPSERLGYQNLVVTRLLALQPEHRRPDVKDGEQHRLVERAESSVLTLIDRFPGHEDVRVLAARFARLINDSSRALSELELAAQAAPTDPAIPYEMHAIAKDSTDPELLAKSKAGLKRAYELSPQNLYVLTEWAQQQSKDKDLDLTATLQNAKTVLAPFVEKVKKFVRIDLGEHLDKTLKLLAEVKSDDDKAWGSIRANVSIMVNVLRPEVARQLDEKRVSKHLLEYVVYDFSAAYYSANSSGELPQADPIPVKLTTKDEAWPNGQFSGTGDIRLVDFDLDGKVDLCLVQPDGLSVIGRGTNGKWNEVVAQSIPAGTRGAAFFDMDRDRNVLATFKTEDGGECADSSLDVVTWGQNGLQVWKNSAGDAGRRLLSEVAQSEAFLAVKDVLSVLPVDFDHDGDVDLVVSAKAGLSLWINRDDFTFGDATPYSALPPADAQIKQMIAVDWNRNVSIDVVCLGANGIGLLENVLHGQFRWQELPMKSDSIKDARSIALLDADSNFSWDLVIGGPKFVDYARTTNPDSGVVKFVGNRSVIETQAAGVTVWDYDNDGFQDLLVWSGATLQTLRGGPAGQFKLQQELTLVFDDVLQIVAVDVEDLDGDGDQDVALSTDRGFALVTNDGGQANKSLRLPIRAEDAKEAQRPNERVNMLGLGSLIELRTGASYVPQVATRQWTHFGLGQKEQADALRVLWTNGVPENFIEPKPGQSVGMQQKLKGSCPYLYAWDGQQMAFVTDCLWAAPVGLQLADGVLAPSREWEFLKVDGERLKAKDGEYRLSLTEELWEVGYIDSVRLLAIDHPADVEVFSNEKVGPPSLAEFRVHTVKQPRTPLAAIDQRGRDVLPLIAQRDEQFVRAFDRRIKQGLTEPHHVELSLGDLKGAQQIQLFLTGWMKPTDTSLNIAISQRPDLESTSPPSIWVPDAKGVWQQVRPYMGFPGGKTKTIAVDLSGVFLSDDYRVRITTTMELYWDHIVFTVDEAPVAVRQTHLPLVAADLRYRGFSRQTPHAQFGPEKYDYSQLAPLTSWPPLDGRLTPYGTVTDFVGTQDSRQVTLGAGDELQLRFQALPDPPRDWKRDFILHNVGWDKDADLNTVFGQTIDPLPYVGMRGYPDPEGVAADVPQPFANQSRVQSRKAFWRKFFTEDEKS